MRHPGRLLVGVTTLVLGGVGAVRLASTPQTPPPPPPASDRVRLATFPLSQVRLLEGPFARAQALNAQYIRALDVDRLLAPFRKEAGLAAKADLYPNWESTGLQGHTAGHYLTALAQAWAATGDAEAKRRLDYMVARAGRMPARQRQRLRRRRSGQPGALDDRRRRQHRGRELRPERHVGALVQPAQDVCRPARRLFGRRQRAGARHPRAAGRLGRRARRRPVGRRRCSRCCAPSTAA